MTDDDDDQIPHTPLVIFKPTLLVLYFGSIVFVKVPYLKHRPPVPVVPSLGDSETRSPRSRNQNVQVRNCQLSVLFVGGMSPKDVGVTRHSARIDPSEFVVERDEPQCIREGL